MIIRQIQMNQKKKLTDLKDQSKRNNFRIDGVAEENGENWGDCK